MILQSVFLSGPLLSQSPTDFEGETIRSTFSTMRFGAQIPEIVYYNSESGEFENLQLMSRVKSKDHKYAGSPIMALYLESDIKSRMEGDPLPLPVAQVDLLAGGERQMLFVFTDSFRTDQNLLVAPMNASQQGFPSGSYRIWNLSHEPVAIQLSSLQEMIPAGAIETLKPDFDDGEHFAVRLVCSTVKDEDWTLFFSNSWKHRADYRVLIFVFNDGENRPPAMFIHGEIPRSD